MEVCRAAGRHQHIVWWVMCFDSSPPDVLTHCWWYNMQPSFVCFFKVFQTKGHVPFSWIQWFWLPEDDPIRFTCQSLFVVCTLEKLSSSEDEPVDEMSTHQSSDQFWQFGHRSFSVIDLYLQRMNQWKTLTDLLTWTLSTCYWSYEDEFDSQHLLLLKEYLFQCCVELFLIPISFSR